MKSFDDHWRAWVQTNLRDGCPKDILFKVLHDSGFGYESIRALLDHQPSIPLARIVSPLSALAGDTPGAPQGAAACPRGGIESWLGSRVVLAGPEVQVEKMRRAQDGMPHLGAGGPECRGFEKRRLPEGLVAELQAGFRGVENDLIEETEAVREGFMATTHPTAPPTLLGIDAELNAKTLAALKPVHEAWCGFELEPVTCFGFRVYLQGAFLRMHVDRLESHVISSALCIAKEVYEPWPLRIEDVDGKMSSVDLEPGEFVLYESTRVLHGRPTPLNGRFHVGLFAHYRPAEDGELWNSAPKAWWEKHGGTASPD